jgi:prefoldin beta subunit
MADPQKRIQALSDEYQQLQTGRDLLIVLSSYTRSYKHVELERTVEARQKLESQFQENKNVQKVFPVFSLLYLAFPSSAKMEKKPRS